jgi:hypothetical protein
LQHEFCGKGQSQASLQGKPLLYLAKNVVVLLIVDWYGIRFTRENVLLSARWWSARRRSLAKHIYSITSTRIIVKSPTCCRLRRWHLSRYAVSGLAQYSHSRSSTLFFFFFFFCCKQRPIFVSGINQSSRSRKIAAATAGATNQYSAAAISNGKLAATGSGAQSTQDVMPTADAQPEHIISAAPVSASTPSPSAPSAEPVASDFVLAAAAVVAETNTRAPAGGTAAYVENAANSEHEVVSEPASTPSDMLMRLSTVATLSTQPSKAAEEAETGRRSARPQLVTPGLAKLLQTVPFAFTCILNLESCQSFCCFVLFFSFVCRPSK